MGSATCLIYGLTGVSLVFEGLVEVFKCAYKVLLTVQARAQTGKDAWIHAKVVGVRQKVDRGKVALNPKP